MNTPMLINNGDDGAGSFQKRVDPWMQACFGDTIARDKAERNHRFLEEALELVQANGCTKSEARQLVDYTFGRPPGEVAQEVGGVMVTLAALCLATGQNMHRAGDVELGRVWTKIAAIRAKQAAKPKYSPLPQHVAVRADDGFAAELVAKLNRVLDLAQACAEHGPEHNAIIADGRAALAEVADFFEVPVPEGC